MNILFLTIGRMDSMDAHSLYPDLLRTFKNNGHKVYSVSPYERKLGKKTEYFEQSGIYCLKVKIGNITKCNIVEKGISTILIETQFKNAIKKYLSDVRFDMVLYSTPPITFVNVIKYIKKWDGAKTYLMLKDIFPQNAVDLGMMSKSGVKGLLYRYFKSKEKKLYAVSDRIGCMSLANCEYILKHNPEISADKVEVCPNSIEVMDVSLTDDEKTAMRKKYGIPCGKTVFVYGGNLGKPQGIPFIIDCLKTQEKNSKAYFLIVGDGTEFPKLEAYFKEANPENMKLMKRLPKEDFDRMIAACDVGMIFLDHRFTIPNFPSRLLSYMQAKLPVLACTDPNTDIGKVILEGGFGWWCESKDTLQFEKYVDMILGMSLKEKSNNSVKYLNDNYHVTRTTDTIMK